MKNNAFIIIIVTIIIIIMFPYYMFTLNIETHEMHPVLNDCNIPSSG